MGYMFLTVPRRMRNPVPQHKQAKKLNDKNKKG